MTTLAVGNYLKLARIQPKQWSIGSRIFILASLQLMTAFNWSFLPFGFSGVSVNRTGDNTSASLVFP